MFEFIDDEEENDEPLNYRVLSPEEREYAWARLMFKSAIINAFEESYARGNKEKEV